MKKFLVSLGILVLLILWLLYSYKHFQNTAVTMQENIKAQWGNVESAYQRRADLIPNLVNTVKGYAQHEKSTLEAVIKARASATQVKIDPSNITPEQLRKFQQAQQGLSGALSRLLLVLERYPDLKANKNFLELQSQLEGTENRIKVERDRFNKAVKDYNTFIRKFPNNIWASLLNFKPNAYFSAEKGAEKAPEVKF